MKRLRRSLSHSLRRLSLTKEVVNELDDSVFVTGTDGPTTTRLLGPPTGRPNAHSLTSLRDTVCVEESPDAGFNEPASSSNSLTALRTVTATGRNFRRHYSCNDVDSPDSSLPSSPRIPPYRGDTSPFGKLDSYQRLEVLGEGSYATVYKGISNVTGQLVALKEIRLQADEGAPFTAIREASLLKQLKHNNIVTLHDIVYTKERMVFVFEYLDWDLSQYLERYGRGGLNPINVKLFLFQMLRGLAFCHARRILHRDIKPQNLLINRGGELKLADFGLARAKSVPSKTYSHEVVTLWYRPPDVLLGSTEYSHQLDMWGVGCIFAEMISGSPLFPGQKDARDQLNKIWRVLGTPDERSWPGVSRLPGYSPELMRWHRAQSLEIVVPKMVIIPESESLCSKMLRLNPAERISAITASDHNYFSELSAASCFLRPVDSVFILPGVRRQAESHSNNLRKQRSTTSSYY